MKGAAAIWLRRAGGIRAEGKAQTCHYISGNFYAEILTEKLPEFLDYSKLLPSVVPSAASSAAALTAASRFLS